MDWLAKLWLAVNLNINKLVYFSRQYKVQKLVNPSKIQSNSKVSRIYSRYQAQLKLFPRRVWKATILYICRKVMVVHCYNTTHSHIWHCNMAICFQWENITLKTHQDSTNLKKEKMLYPNKCIRFYTVYSTHRALWKKSCCCIRFKNERIYLLEMFYSGTF